MAGPLEAAKNLIGAIDRWQRRHRSAAVVFAVSRKFSNDNANLLVVALGWYGFTAIFPLLLVVVTVFGFVGAASLGNGVLTTLHQFPVIGSQLIPGSGGSRLHGSVFGLVIGAVGLLYGAQGVTQTAEQAMARVWNLPETEWPGFLPRLGRSVSGLITIAVAFFANSVVAPIAAGHGTAFWIRIVAVAGMLAVNCGFYLVAFRALTPGEVAWRDLLPGAIAGAVFFTALITLGAGLMQHQLRNSSATYGAMAAVIGLVTFLLLLAKLTMYSAELNPVLSRRLYPRALPTCPPTPADNEVLREVVHEQRQRPDQRIGVGFDPNASEQAAEDAADGDGVESGGRSIGSKRSPR
jgi:uncharacterized BrkB/YihY/UPF0761 family membrane protein